MQIVDSHFMAAFMACSAACDIVQILPQGDLTDELQYLIETQFDLFSHILEKKHYGTDSLNEFIEYTDEVRREMMRLSKELAE